MIKLIDFLFNTTDYPARWHCGNWSPLIGWTYITSDLLVFLAYVGIPFSILYYQSKIKAIELNYVFYLFAAFIFSCGTTHLIDALIFWKPIYNFAALILLITAVVSLMTLFLLTTKLPITLKFIKEKIEARELRLELNVLKAEGEVLERIKMDKLKDEFISMVSHELRTPITSIRGALGLLGVEDLPLSIKHLIEIASRNCDRLSYLINDLLDMQKLESGTLKLDLKMVDIAELIIHSVDLNQPFAKKSDVILKIVEPINHVYVMADYNRLHQVIDNLISNAIKFSKTGGEITISVSVLHDMVRVSVSDTGIGIPEEFHTKIFGKFTQADSGTGKERGGTGLGLYISKSIIKLLNGNINFISSSKGTTFYFDLPYKSQN